MKATEVFTPSDYPLHTYVERDSAAMERRLKNALATPGEIISVSGPSKSGKTVLVQNAVGTNNLISVSGAGVTDSGVLWERILDWMEAPSSEVASKSGSVSGTGGAGATAGGGIIVAHGEVNTHVEVSFEGSKEASVTRERRGLTQVVAEIAGSPFVVFVDDFHYMPRTAQVDVARSIKDAAGQGVKVVVASVPHRADDVVRGNAELRGRVRSVDVGYWGLEDLARIGTIGFPLLNMTVPVESISRLAREASGSPQLMQAMCLDVCFAHDVQARANDLVEAALTEDELVKILGETATRTDHRRMVRQLHGGPALRGKERTQYTFADGTSGDVYRAILLTLASEPPTLSWTYNELATRMAGVVAGARPTAQSVYESCEQMAKIALNTAPTERVLEWDGVQRVLDIVDPYLLFYLRWSGLLGELR